MSKSLRKIAGGGVVAIGLAALLLDSGCSTTVASTPPPPRRWNQVDLAESGHGFLGPDASKLAPRPEGGAALVWVNPNAQWATYTKVQLMPVEFWAAADSKVSTATRQR